MRWFHSIALAFVLSMSPAWSGESAPSAKLGWSSFLEKLEKQNPRIQALKSKVEIEESSLSLELPAPTLGVSSMGMNGPTSGVMERTYELSQKVPFPTKFFKASSVKDAKVSATESEAKLSIQKLKSEGSELFVSLAQAIQEQALLLEKKKVYENHLKRLKSLSLSDQIQRIHILEINAEVKTTDSEIAESKQKEQATRIKIAALLDEQDPFSEIPVLETMPTPESLDARSSNLSLHSVIENRERLADSEKSFATQAWMPDLILTYRKHDRFDNVMPSSQEVMIGIELPFLWGWQPSQKNKMQSASRDEVHFENRENELNSKAEIQTLKDELKTLWERISLLSHDILPIEEQRVHLLHSITPSDMESLDLHKSVLEKWLSDRMKLLELESNYRKTYLKLDVMTSVNTGTTSGGGSS